MWYLNILIKAIVVIDDYSVPTNSADVNRVIEMT